VNPTIPIGVQISVWDAQTTADGNRAPEYATPGSFTASVDGTVLDITAIAQGVPQIGQMLADGSSAILAGTMITGQLTGLPGGIGTYSLNQAQTVASEAMTTSMTLQGQIQPITWRDLQQMDGINLGGVRWKIYLYGEVDAVVRPEKKGGDLITIFAPNQHAGVWLVAQVLEAWNGWVCAAIVLQDGA
jgi:hypothetical protein